jgi:hypothetical protein
MTRESRAAVGRHDARQILGVREEGEDILDREGYPLLELETASHKRLVILRSAIAAGRRTYAARAKLHRCFASPSMTLPVGGLSLPQTICFEPTPAISTRKSAPVAVIK